jgi:hypothetical protein
LVFFEYKKSAKNVIIEADFGNANDFIASKILVE